MAGKMIEPDSNTQDMQLSPLTPGSVHNDDNYSNAFENGDGYLNSCNVLPNNNIMCEKLLLPLDSDGNCSKSDLMYGTSKTGDCTSSLLQGNSPQIGHLQEDDSPLKSPDYVNDSSDKNISYLSNNVDAWSGVSCDTDDVKLNSVTRSSISDVSNGIVLKKSNGKSKIDRKKLNLPGRRRAHKGLVTVYQSQISGDKNAIKIRIKKSNLTAQVKLTPNKKKSGKRKKDKIPSDTDASDYETPTKRTKALTNTQEYINTEEEEPLEQSVWGDRIPELVLWKIFEIVCQQEGSLPILVRLSKVCKLWRNIAQNPSLWRKVDLNCVRERFRTDQKLNWLLENRLHLCEDLSLGIWKVRNVQITFESLIGQCKQLRGLNLSGWKGLNAESLKYITSEAEKLERLDLSSINSTASINAQPFICIAQSMNSRLTHLVLAHNKLPGLTQIITALSAHCPNLELLDISNIKTYSHSSAMLHVEKLQTGCQKLKVLRITNSQIYLAPATISQQVVSPGFPMLEELSLAGLQNDRETTTSRFLDDNGIERILKTSTKLRLLDVRGCIRLTGSGLVKVPAWDLEHLFLSSCYVTRTQYSDLELIVQKWSHSLLEVDLAWTTVTSSLDAAVFALAEKGAESRLKILNLCGSSVSLEPVKAVLTKCPKLESINLQSCRALPRGIKRLYTGDTVNELRQSLQDKSKSEGTESDGEIKSSENKNV